MKQRISKTTIATRIRRGWTKEEAENTPLLCEKTLTLEKVLDVEKHGLSLNKSAHILGVHISKLARYIDRHGIAWRGRKPCFRLGQPDPNSTLQKIVKSGNNYSTIMYRMDIKGMALDEAIEKGRAKK